MANTRSSFLKKRPFYLRTFFFSATGVPHLRRSYLLETVKRIDTAVFIKSIAFTALRNGEQLFVTYFSERLSCLPYSKRNSAGSSLVPSLVWIYGVRDIGSLHWNSFKQGTAPNTVGPFIFARNCLLLRNLPNVSNNDYRYHVCNSLSRGQF